MTLVKNKLQRDKGMKQGNLYINWPPLGYCKIGKPPNLSACTKKYLLHFHVGHWLGVAMALFPEACSFQDPG